MKEPLLNAEQLAKELNVSISFVRNKTAKKEIPHYKIGIRTFYHLSKVLAHFERFPKGKEPVVNDYGPLKVLDPKKIAERSA